MQLRVHALVVAAIFTIILLTSAKLRSQKVLTNPDQSPPSSFGVGFDLSASYGSAAVSFSNGTIITVTTLPGNNDYNEVLQRLSLDSSKHLSPPYNNVGDSWDDMARQYKRKARKAVGLPASSDVGHLANMLSDLRAAVEAKVGPITTGGVTTMHLVALYDEDLHDAFEHVRLKYVTFPVGDVGHNILYETSAAYAGYLYGLCSEYKADPQKCKNEQYNMTDRAVMAVVYTDTVISVSLSVIRSAYALFEPKYRYLADFDLGFQKSLEMNSEEYWDAIKGKLQAIMIENPNYDHPSLVMLMGDRTDDPQFKHVLTKALDEQMEELPEILSKGSQAVAARGLAEMTKRATFVPDEPQVEL